MGRGFGHLGWLEKEKGQVQPRGPGSGPQMVPLGPLFCTPYPHPCHTDPGGLHLRLSFGLTSSLSGHLTSPSAAKPDLLSLQGPVFPLLQPHCGCSVPLSFTVSQGSGCSSHVTRANLQKKKKEQTFLSILYIQTSKKNTVFQFPKK